MRTGDRVRVTPWPLAVWICAILALTPAVSGAPLGAPSDRYYIYQLDNISTVNALQILRTLNFQVQELGTPGDASLERPVVIAMPDSDPAVSSLVQRGTSNLGGNPIDGPTAGAPHQRLLIVWDAADPGSLERLLGLLQEQIDVRAKQILIEAVVLELDRSRIRDLGVSFEGSKDGQSFRFDQVNGVTTPFTYVFERPSVKTMLNLDVKIEALVRDGDASILSQPSIMVLDGRQARIKVGDNLPYTTIAASGFDLESQIVTDTKYIETGITLNLRPRASEDDSEVTMQVETLISTPDGPSFVLEGAGVVGPQISTREVQTLVRVADDTPFIIGGLISEDDFRSRAGVPGLSKIPGLGALFRRTNRSRLQKEVIIVITPHIMPLAERSFHYSVVGKDFENLDRFEGKLFRNLYRIKSEDIFDLDFIYDSDLYEAMLRASARWGRDFARRAVAAGWEPVPPGDRAALAKQMRQALVEQPTFLREIEGDYPGLDFGEPLIALVEGGIPGEDVLVKRMLLGIIEKLDFGSHVDPQKIIFFDAVSYDAERSPELLEIERLLPRLEGLGQGCGGQTLRMVFETETEDLGAAGSEVSFDPPGAKLDTVSFPDDEAYVRELRRLNQLQPTGDYSRLGILLNDCFEKRGQSTLDTLRSVLALKRLIDINPALPLTLNAFHSGRELVFPAAENLRTRNHVVDRKVAELFYETMDYFYAFEKTYEKAHRTIEALMRPEASLGSEESSEAPGDI